MTGSIPFIPGQPRARSGPLERFLPPIAGGVAKDWLQARFPPGSWVLDPFGAAPQLAVEAARAGYRVLVAANNPIARFMLEMAASSPKESELRAALADLGASYRRDERIEPHIRALYLTNCAQCRQEIMAEAFVWDRGAPAPSSRIYRCSHCGSAGEHPSTETDAAHAAQFASGGLHRARALERVAPLDDPDRPHVEEALEVYLPRAVYALFTLINKLESFPAHRRTHLAALLLAACDQANTLWSYPTARARPRQLTVPPRFRENNVWLALENAVAQWATDAPAVPFSTWPEQPPIEGGISVFEGRLKDLGGQGNLARIPIAAVLAALPRPNQAFWTLSALWAGWLWGREAAAPFKSVLRRRRYDWAWHSTALHAALKNLTPLLKPGTPFYGLIGEAEPGFLSAAMIAAGSATFDLSGIALRAENGQAQIDWRSGAGKKTELAAASPEPAETDPASMAVELSQAAGQAYLCERGAPAGYLYLHTAALIGLTQQETLASLAQPEVAETLGQVQAALQKAFSYRGGFVRFGGSEHSLEIGQWWLRSDETGGKRSTDNQPEKISTPLADRVEMDLVRYLQKNPGCSVEELDAALCAAFPGLLTPDPGLIQSCLESYAEQAPPGSGHWQLRLQDAPKSRRNDLAVINALLAQLGQNLGFEVTGQSPQLWQEPDGEAVFAFYSIASAVIGEIIFSRNFPPQQSLIVYPGGRASLVAYKLQNDARLSQAVTEGWRFLKYRHVRRLAENPRLRRDNLDEQLSLDPLTSSEPQMPLL